MKLRQPYLLFLGDAADPLAAKTAAGIAHWRPEACIGQLRLPGCQADLGLPDMSVEAAAAAGARTLVIGVANRGGVIAPAWVATMLAALDAGLDLANGLHQRLSAVPEIKARASARGRALFEVRIPDREFAVGSGVRRPGKRLLTVGTDVSSGKMYTALAITRELQARGRKATFRATGQTGIFIAGEGVSVDAVVADFISGATEWLCPANDPAHWDLVEGQGSLYHPSYAGVTLGLIHGAQPDAMVMCHDASRTHHRGVPHQRLPGLKECIEANEWAARVVNQDARVIGIALNTSKLGAEEARRVLAETADRHGLPAVDPVRTGVGPLVDRLG